MNTSHNMRFAKSLLATAILSATGFTHAAITDTMTNGTFQFFDSTGTEQTAFGHNDVQGAFDLVNRTGQFTTSTPFSGETWVADVNAMTFHSSAFGGTSTAPEVQTYTWVENTFLVGSSLVSCRIAGSIDNCATAGLTGTPLVSTTGSYTYSLLPGQFAFHTFFDWSVNPDIPVLVTANTTNNPAVDGYTDFVSFDGDNDGVPGVAMVTAPFPGQTPAFSGRIQPASCSYTVSAPADITVRAVPGTSAATVNIGTASVSDINTGAIFTPTATLAPSTPLTPGTDVSFPTGVSTITWDKQGTTEVNCDSPQTVTVHDWNPPVDVTVTDNTPATGVSLGTPTDLAPAANPNGTPLAFTNDAPATGFDPGTTVVTWTATDALGGTTTATQNVTVNLPAGIAGAGCTIDLTTPGSRNLSGIFTMRDQSGAITGSVDMTVTGDIDPTAICPDESCMLSGATMVTAQPFFGELWQATPIRLFDVGTYTFESCPGDNSTNCAVPPPPRPLSMTVKDAASNGNVPQLGAHMLFEWSVNKDIDVVVVWDVDCGASMLTTTDPDGDGILGTKMVDGPFQGFNAAFDVTTVPGETPIALGGFEVGIPVYKSPFGGGSPLALNPTVFTSSDFPADSSVISSCTIDGCFGFTINGVTPLSTIDVVLPLSQSIPFYSVYRKFMNGAWKDFTVDTNNSIKTAALNAATGLCPEPGSTNYAVPPSNSAVPGMLTPGHQCIQLTIQDNGANDTDPAQGTVSDPGGVALFPAPPQPTTATSGGGCTISGTSTAPTQRSDWLILGLLVMLLGWFNKVRVIRRLQG